MSSLGKVGLACREIGLPFCLAGVLSTLDTMSSPFHTTISVLRSKCQTEQLHVKTLALKRLLNVPFLSHLSGQLGKRVSLVTRGEDAKFSTFVNAVVTATINAVYAGITKQNSNEMHTCLGMS